MKIFFCFGLLLCSFYGFAQLRDKGTIELAPIIGYSTSATPLTASGSDYVTDIQIGSHIDYFFNNRWSIRSGLLLQTMGTKKIKFLFFESDYSEKTRHLTVPLVINWHFGSTRKWYFNYGTSIGLLLEAKADNGGGNGYVDIKDNANSFQFGVNTGVGYKLEISPKLSIVFDASFMLGLTDTNKEETRKNFYSSYNTGLVFKL